MNEVVVARDGVEALEYLLDPTSPAGSGEKHVPGTDIAGH